MSYSTPAMLRKALVPTSDGTQPEQATNTAADLTDDQLQDSINEADSVIDSYIGRYYSVPVAPVAEQTPHPIDYWSRNIAAFNATLAFRGSMDFSDTDPVQKRYNATMSALEDVAAGKVGLQLPDNTSINSATGAGSSVNPFVGTLWGPEDFNLRPTNPGWPIVPDWMDGRGHW